MHCEFAIPPQVSPATQPLMAVHVVQARSFVVEQAVLSYVPAAQVPEQAAQESERPSTRCRPDAQIVH